MVLSNKYSRCVLHELWDDPDSHECAYLTFCLVGPEGDGARSYLTKNARLTWTIEADSHFEAMTLYYAHQGWGLYTTEFPEIDKETYAQRGWDSPQG